eukprot:Gb_23391 [translate_table: standard]
MKLHCEPGHNKQSMTEMAKSHLTV